MKYKNFENTLPPSVMVIAENSADDGRHRLSAGNEHDVQRDQQTARIGRRCFGNVQRDAHASQSLFIGRQQELTATTTTTETQQTIIKIRKIRKIMNKL